MSLATDSIFVAAVQSNSELVKQVGGRIYGDYRLCFFFELIQALSYIFFNYIANHLSVSSRKNSFHKLYSYSHLILRNYEF